ncbi:hypothetical protein LJR125_001995 [Pseudoxanthomonas sp. LjRoot125]|uniref:hypothetical protein n=1 Tax=Pseudoxanthomonas sp. LjRoot125 TaxID=3342258 RepID=UPI003E11472D
MTVLMVGFAIFAVALGGFWLLYGVVVCTRLVDDGVVVTNEHEWDPILRNWPTVQLRAYRKQLAPEETTRWFNWYLFNARTILRVLTLLYFITFIAVMLRN